MNEKVKYSKEPDNPTNCEFIRFLSDFSFGKKIGKTKVFLRAGQMAELDARRAKVLRNATRITQRQMLAGEVPPLYGECIGTNKESKEFAGELFEAGHHDRIRVRSHDGNLWYVVFPSESDKMITPVTEKQTRRNFSMDPPSRISSAEAYEMCSALWRQLKRRVITENTRKDVVESNIGGQASITESANQRRSTNIDLHNDTAIG
ncbi:hypothetical protein Tco_0792848 [Tanacetum coccineum]